jgi:LacI family transcriptional regulator
MRRVTLRDVAEKLGVSSATVSNALNRPHMVSRATLQRVHAAIAETGYVADDAAKLLRKGVSNSIGVIVSDSSNPFFNEMLEGVDAAASAAGLFVLQSSSNGSAERERDYIRFMESQRVRGLILAPARGIPKEIIEMGARGTPFVILGEAPSGAEFPTVSGDDLRGGRMAAAHLLAGGRRKILFVGDASAALQMANRLEGARIEIAKQEGASLEVLETAADDVAAGVAAGEHIRSLAASERPDAVQAGNDLLAIGVLQALAQDRRIRVPEDIAVIGYDDVRFAASAAVPLSSIRHPSYVIGRTALDLLIQEEAQSRHQQHLVFAPELVVRQSSAEQDSRS